MNGPTGKPGLLEGDRSWLAVLLLIAATLAVYAPVWEYGFVDLDDDLYVLDNLRVQSGLSWTNIGWALTALEAGFWHPLTWISHMADCQLFGLQPAGHHVTSLVIHVANAVLLFWVLQLMTSARWPSVLVAALFSLHPLNVESVAWIAERKNVLSTFFGLLAIWAYVKYVEKPDWRRYLLLTALFVLGLMSKPMLVTLPCVLLLLDYWPLNRFAADPGNFFSKLRELALEKAPLLLLSLAAGPLAILAESRAGALPALEAFPLSVRFSNALVAYTSYLSKMFWPTDLAPFYPHPGASLEIWRIVLSVVLLVAVSAVVVHRARSFPYLVVGWLWYLGTLFPVSGLIQVGGHAMADRYAYLPLIGVFILLVWGWWGWLGDFPVARKLGGGALLCLFAGMAMTTRTQVSHWQSSVTLFEHVIRSTENNHLAYNNLGIALLERGRMEEAAAQFAEALKIKPGSSTALFNLGLTMKRRGETEEAERYFSKALEENPKLAGAHVNLGTILEEQGSSEEAFRHFRQAVELNPRLPAAHTNLGRALAKQGKFGEAVGHFEISLRINPHQSNVYSNLGAALDLQGRSQEAVDNYRRALELDSRSHFAHHNLGMLRLEEGHLEEAAHHLSRAIEIKPDFVSSHYGLGLTRLQQGRISEAIRYFRQVLKLDPEDVRASRQLRRLLEQPRDE